MHSPREGEVRVTVPLDGAALSVGGEVSNDTGRLWIAEGVELVALDEDERARLAGRGIHTDCRLEFFGLLPEAWDYLALFGLSKSQTQPDALAKAQTIVGRVQQVLSLHALASRSSWRPATIVLDRFEDGTWRRDGFLEATAEWSQKQRGFSWFALEQLGTWQALVREWPNDPVLNLALQYYAESVIDLRDGRNERALVAAAIATEVLLGERSELSYRISVRGAHLVAVGHPGIAVQRRLKRLYDVRSGLVHGGKPVPPEECVNWQQFLMSALPRAAAFPGAPEVLRHHLDQANFVRSEDLITLDGDGWWSFCDFAALLEPQA